ncbi:3-hydroxyacyl-CoA dehydrogenase/enoyl-CoA hydratase family protein [Thermogemmatispora onikobensis]|uniref:3-hydroxyacyl-CoA dehydrogenase/enoyl-CoA hydratase family protein n=1 Tax=Thermogemmatispora onikobensis TaxID=732234 RepID=UPI00085294BB|nr:3-hydroxyacyl-CoA dehydrogenase/enoyl-CoA hydratase family protein [Thermogemmatispora onikobensis]
MGYQIRKAAVIGAGVMGAAIAAHLANVGIPSLLLDIVPPDAGADRNRVARTGLERALKARPAAFYSPKKARLITVGNIEDNLEEAAQADWIVEAVFERLDVKQQLYDRLEPLLGENTIVSSNTSGLPAHLLTAGRSERFRRHFLITHFFNPVRYMRLLEIVPDQQTDPALVSFMQDFATEVLGKGVVLAKDTPNFIANRIGVYGFLSTIRRALEEGYSVSEVDAILGPSMGRPKSAVFRTADLSGLDTLVHVADNIYENAPDDPEREVFRVPEVVRELVRRGWLGEKSGQGFYKRIKNPGGESTILELNLQTLEYQPQQKPRFESIGAARNIDDPAERMLTVLNGNDRAAQLARETLADSLIYAARLAPEIADSVVAVDQAMRWGFNFDLGSFEGWDILLEHPETLYRVLRSHPSFKDVSEEQAPATLSALAEKHAARLPELVRQVITQGEGRFYSGPIGQRRYFDFHSGSYQPVPQLRGSISLSVAKAQDKVIRENGSASLIDLGDGIVCVEFHTKMNAIDQDIIEMLHYVVEEGQKQYRAIVIANEAPDFSAGANLFLMLVGARNGQWEMLEQAVNSFQQVNMLLKYSPIPVVVAPTGRTLGGGCEIVMHSSHVRAHAETYIGLVEVGAGLVPGGGGVKELLLRHGARLEDQQSRSAGGPFAAPRRVFEIVAMATVATSAVEAQEYRFLRKSDSITTNRDLLLRDAKADALRLAEAREAGRWQPPQPAMLLLPGPGGRLVLEQQIDNMLLTGKITEHDAVIGRHLARIVTGGNTSPLTPLTEQQVLDLEREAFLSLCGMEKTQERMQAILMTGKPLRN